jgi:hypothetical protein
MTKPVTTITENPTETPTETLTPTDTTLLTTPTIPDVPNRAIYAYPIRSEDRSKSDAATILYTAPLIHPRPRLSAAGHRCHIDSWTAAFQYAVSDLTPRLRVHNLAGSTCDTAPECPPGPLPTGYSGVQMRRTG